jgi:two-component system, chemotaxis family, sensor kinase Cph1
MSAARPRILLAEDEFLVALSTTDLLENAGCEIVGPVSRVAPGRGLALSETLDAAVLDINLAGEMAWPIAEALTDRGVPFVFLSAYVPQSVIPTKFAAVPRLDKPVDGRRLLSELEALWEHAGASRRASMG